MPLLYNLKKNAPLICLDLAMAVGFSFLIHRHSLLTHFDHLPGDQGDTRLILVILEHLTQCVRQFNFSNLTNLPMFFPVKITLSYSDCEFYGLILYIPWRILGFSIYKSFAISCFTLTCIGFLSMRLFLSRYTSLGLSFSRLGAGLFSVPQALPVVLGSGHPQLRWVAVYPILTLLLAKYLSSANSKQKKSKIYAVGFWTFFSGLLLTSFYQAWFYMLVVCIAAGIYLLGIAWWIKLKKIPFSFSISDYLPLLLFNFGTAALALLPFFIIYFPSYKLFGKRHFLEILQFTPRWSQAFFNIFSDNDLLTRARFAEASVSMPIFSAALASLYGLWLTFQLLKQYRNRASLELPKRDLIHLGVAFAFVSLCVCATKIYSDKSLWKIIYYVIPGASAIRCPGRVFLAVWPFVAVLNAHFLKSLYQGQFFTSKNPLTKLLCALLIIMLFFENLVAVPYRGFSGTDDHMRIESLGLFKAPPSGCTATTFAPVSSDSQDIPFFTVQILDLIIASQQHQLPSLLGYSGQHPIDWNLDDLADPGYPFKVQKWALSHGVPVQDICAFDLNTKTWGHWQRVPDSYLRLDPPYSISFGRKGNQHLFLRDGWGTFEPQGRWSIEDSAVIEFSLDAAAEDFTCINLTLSPFVPLDSSQIELAVTFNDLQIGTRRLTKTDVDAENVVFCGISPETIRRENTIRFHINGKMSPADLGISPDGRKLGIFLRSLTLTP
jgi:hypothetical protein